MKQLKEIPKFKDEDEERVFWDTHEIFDYLDPKKFVETAPPMIPRTIHVSVPIEMEREVELLSKERKVSIEEMSLLLLAAGLKQQHLHSRL